MYPTNGDNARRPLGAADPAARQKVQTAAVAALVYGGVMAVTALACVGAGAAGAGTLWVMVIVAVIPGLIAAASINAAAGLFQGRPNAALRATRPLQLIATLFSVGIVRALFGLPGSWPFIVFGALYVALTIGLVVLLDTAAKLLRP